MGSANGALELIGRLTGVVVGKQHQEPHVPITRVTINLAPEVESPADQIVEAEEYRELPRPRAELAAGMTELSQRRGGQKTEEDTPGKQYLLGLASHAKHVRMLGNLRLSWLIATGVGGPWKLFGWPW